MYAVLPKGSKPSKTVSKDQTRPILTDAELQQTQDGGWELLATDSYQLARIPLTVRDNDSSDEPLTPGPISTEALKAIEKTGAFRANGSVVPVDSGFGRDAGPSYPRETRDTRGQYPNVDQLMPDDSHLGAVSRRRWRA